MKYEFAESFLDLAFDALTQSSLETEEQERTYEILREVCAKHGLSLRKYIAATVEISQKMTELGVQNDQD